MPPLIPILVPLVATAILLSVLFARYLPSPRAPEPHPSRWTDITPDSGITFLHHDGAVASPTTLGGSVVILDYNRDQRPDLFFVNGTHWPWEEESAETAERPTSALYRNDGGGRFTDVSAAAGVDLELQGVTAAAGDYDRDGWPDLYVTAVGRNRLLRNATDGTFTDTTATAGVGGEEYAWSSGAVWLDYDNDGWLDLLVCHYARWPREIDLELAFKISGVGRSYGAPAGFVSAVPSLYRNRGDGSFAIVPDSAGLRNIDPGTGLPRSLPVAVTALDANGDPWLDVLIVHQNQDEVLYLNTGDGSFRPWAPVLERRREGAAAGMAATGGFTLAPTSAPGGQLATLRSLFAALPPRESAARGEIGRRLGLVLLDYGLDGTTSALVAGSQVEPDINRFDEGRDFAAPLLLLSERAGTWHGSPPTEHDRHAFRPLVARGLAAADFDGDGDSDAVVIEHGGAARLLRNDQRAGRPWLRLELVATRSAPGAGGARVEVHTPRRVHVRTVAPPMSLLAQSEAVLTFGLGEDARVRRIVITWPTGARQEMRPAGLNRTLQLIEP